MKNDIEAGFSALFEFGFDRYLTISIVKIVYKLCFAAVCLSALVSLGAIFSFGRQFLGYSDYAQLLQLAALALVIAGHLVLLAMVRLWLEALVVHFKGYQRSLAVDPRTGQSTVPSASKPRPSVSPTTNAHWTCGCGWTNDGPHFCGSCGRRNPGSEVPV